MTTQIEIPDDTKTYFDELISHGIVSWNTPQNGVTVPDEVQAVLEMLHAFLASAELTVNRDGNGYVTSISRTGGSSTIEDGLKNDMEDGINAYAEEEIGQGDGCVP